jgi:hypothetical protein
MKIDVVPVQKLIISDLPRLDPIHAYMEDTAPGQGSLTVRCYGKSWTAFWNAMGPTTEVEKFVRSCDADYIVNSLSPGLPATKFSSDALTDLAKKIVLGRRRASLMPTAHRYNFDPCDKGEARELFRVIADLPECDSLNDLPHQPMEQLFGAEWWFTANRAVEPNPDYVYLTRIVEAFQAALVEIKPATEPTAPAESAPSLPAASLPAHAPRGPMR